MEVIASRVQSALFLRLFAIATPTPSARAVAYLGSGTGCMYALNPAASGAVLQ